MSSSSAPDAAAADEVRYDFGGWISGPQVAGGGWVSGQGNLGADECGDRKATYAGGMPWLWCCLSPVHVSRGELHESADYEWDDQMLFARMKGYQ